MCGSHYSLYSTLPWSHPTWSRYFLTDLRPVLDVARRAEGGGANHRKAILKKKKSPTGSISHFFPDDRHKMVQKIFFKTSVIIIIQCMKYISITKVENMHQSTQCSVYFYKPQSQHTTAKKSAPAAGHWGDKPKKIACGARHPPQPPTPPTLPPPPTPTVRCHIDDHYYIWWVGRGPGVRVVQDEPHIQQTNKN